MYWGIRVLGYLVRLARAQSFTAEGAEATGAVIEVQKRCNSKTGTEDFVRVLVIRASGY